tara:strand:+ start:122 stop:628 length:507 start_codon:yes stop_codon:yes gene_type:complete
MTNELEKKISFAEQVKQIFIQNKKIFIFFLIALILILIGSTYFNYTQVEKNRKISEKYIYAGIMLSLKENKKSKKIYKEIILSKNQVYATLALNNIIEKKLETNSEEILKLFKVVETIKMDKEKLNLIKLKKALYLLKISKNEDGNKLLNEIISENSIWKNTAIELVR